MTKRQEIFYGISLLPLLGGALAVEARPLAAMAEVIASGLCVRIAEKKGRMRRD